MYLCTSFYANILLMKKNLLLTVCLLAAINGSAQKKDFSYKFYGQIRTDLYYNSRANQETVDGLFYMYPLDERLDANGKDLNATANGSFYTLYTRLGVDVTCRSRSGSEKQRHDTQYKGERGHQDRT